MKKRRNGEECFAGNRYARAIWTAAVLGLTALTALSGCGAGGSKESATEGAPSGIPQAYETKAEMDITASAITAGEAAANDGGSALIYESKQNTAASGLADQYEALYGQEGYSAEEYSYIEENGYKKVADEPLSTFSVDVDTASYGNIRRMLRTGAVIPADAVRIEELINYFNYDYPEPDGDAPFSVTTEYAPCPWNVNSRLLLIGLQAKEIDFADRPASNLVFLLDVSGSMYSADKLPLVQKAFTMLTENLDERDRVSIVTYAGYESVVLDGVSGTQKAKIAAALDDLEAGGSTAGAAGIERAYEIAQKNFIPGGNNRVILATDGDLNVGISSEGALTRLIQKKRESGVHLSVLGVGTGNIKDNKMEALADNGNGNYHYLDSIYEAKKVLVDEMGGTLITVAKDVKIQVEFNPAQVAGYRLVGYENRLLNQEDFDNDRVDAGEIGSGHSVTALYEIIPAAGETSTTKLKYQETKITTGSSELLTVKLRYKAPNGNTSKLLEYPVEASVYQDRASDNLTFACAVAEFGMLLRDSEHKGSADFEQVMELAESCVGRDTDDYKKEFLELVRRAADIYQ
ncbi:MAG: DUF3520 domain-containing protein [Lachnospiraceae bacterium]|nr:DUF3520 domain-containing protein [Lachnospiraceae bacterium]